MSINVYLIPDWRESEFAAHISVSRNKVGREFIALGSTERALPPKLVELVEEITLSDSIPIIPRRESGLYHNQTKSARAEVENNASVDCRKNVFITGKNIEDVQELFLAIKSGNIYPSMSYEDPQGGKSRAELEAEVTHWQRQYGDANFELKRVNGLLKEVEEDYLEYHDQVAGHIDDGEKIQLLRQLLGRIANCRWPFCTRPGIVRQISKILGIKVLCI